MHISPLFKRYIIIVLCGLATYVLPLVGLWLNEKRLLAEVRKDQQSLHYSEGPDPYWVHQERPSMKLPGWFSLIVGERETYVTIPDWLAGLTGADNTPITGR